MSKLLESKSGWENRIYIGTRSVFSCHVETVVLMSRKDKKEKIARRSGQKTMQQVMGQDMERKKK